jgi:hypothetical protein
MRQRVISIAFCGEARLNKMIKNFHQSTKPEKPITAPEPDGLFAGCE